jgi:ubiquinone/menaquinone biosynthesis C-methylase UbiE
LSAIYPKQYKETQRHNWDSVAHGWEKWWRIIEIGAEKVSRRLIELASIKVGSKVLDISTGIGEPAITAAREVGNTGQVLATDISSEMLSIAKQRAINAGLQHVIAFKQGDTGTIELPNSTFDAAICRFGLMFLPDLHTEYLRIIGKWRSLCSCCLGITRKRQSIYLDNEYHNERNSYFAASSRSPWTL